MLLTSDLLNILLYCLVLSYYIKLAITSIIKFEDVINCYYVTLMKFKGAVFVYACFCNDSVRFVSRDLQME